MVSNGTDNMVMPVAPMYGGYNGFGWGGDWAWIILLSAIEHMSRN